MGLLDDVKFLFSFLLNLIPVQLNTLKFFLFSPLHIALGTDPHAKSAFPVLSFLPSISPTPSSSPASSPSSSPLLGGRRKPCPYANGSSHIRHEFRAPGPDDARSPCPALNTMANHGYLPHNGRNLTGTVLTNALMECYNLSWPLAAFLSWGGVLLLGQVGTLSLSDLARHNRIEHDASLTHANTPFSDDYAPKRNCPKLYEKFLRDARKGGFGADDIARARVRREDVEGPREGTEVTSVQQEIARGEVALVLQIFGGKEYKVPIEVVKSWWGENKLPEGWKPTRLTTLHGTIQWSTTIRHAMDGLRKARTYAGADVEEVINIDEKQAEEDQLDPIPDLPEQTRTKTVTTHPPRITNSTSDSALTDEETVTNSPPQPHSPDLSASNTSTLTASSAHAAKQLLETHTTQPAQLAQPMVVPASA